jgi:flagellar M-ring protein FliF
MDRKKIPYRLADGGTTILVPSGMVDGTRLDLMGGNMSLKSNVGFELFNKADLGLTDFAQKINYQRALQGELERTIMTLDGVDTARVHLSLGEDRLFRDDQVAPKASVTIRMTKGRHLSEGTSLGVRRLVAAAVPKLDASDVVILDEEGRTVDFASQPSAQPSPLVEERRAIEGYYQGRLRQALTESGLSDISVFVSATLSPADSATLSAWTPAQRRFPLRIALSSSVPWSIEWKDKVRETVDKAIGAPGQSDTLMFEAAPIETTPLQLPPAEKVRPRPMAPIVLGKAEEGGGVMEWLLIGLPVLVVFLAGLLLVWKLRGPRPLDARRRAEFVDRIRVILEEREGHVATRP